MSKRLGFAAKSQYDVSSEGNQKSVSMSVSLARTEKLTQWLLIDIVFGGVNARRYFIVCGLAVINFAQ